MWIGVVDWSTGLEHWTGALEHWNTGVQGLTLPAGLGLGLEGAFMQHDCELRTQQCT